MLYGALVVTLWSCYGALQVVVLLLLLLLLLITNRKSYTRFRLVPKSTTLVDPEMTLDGIVHSVAFTHVFLSQPLKFA